MQQYLQVRDCQGYAPLYLSDATSHLVPPMQRETRKVG